MLGFPIRTPPDHSLVANSPGLIAGSNVLHRLLMPRHPPCALHSLSQQRQNNTRRNTCRSNTIDHKPKNTRPAPQSKEQAGTDSHSPPPARKTGDSEKINYTLTTRTNRHLDESRQRPPGREDARVHYADLKQQPHQPPHPPTQEKLGRREEPEAQPDTSPHPDNQAGAPAPTADPSGPNSVFNHPPTNVRPMTRTRPSKLTASCHQVGPTSSRRSTSETPPCASEHSSLVGVCAP